MVRAATTWFNSWEREPSTIDATAGPGMEDGGNVIKSFQGGTLHLADHVVVTHGSRGLQPTEMSGAGFLSRSDNAKFPIGTRQQP